MNTDVCTDSSDSENSDVSIQEDIQKDELMNLPCVDAIKNATLVLVEFGKTTKRCSNKYRYAAICLSNVEEDGDVKVMCMKGYGDSGRLSKWMTRIFLMCSSTRFCKSSLNLILSVSGIVLFMNSKGILMCLRAVKRKTIESKWTLTVYILKVTFV